MNKRYVVAQAIGTAAVALQASMAIDTTNTSARLAVSTKILNGISCLFTVYGDSVGGRKSDDIEKITVDTITRLHAYEKYNQAESGSMLTFPPGDGCGN